MKREATVCGLVFIKYCVLNDKVDICWIIPQKVVGSDRPFLHAGMWFVG